MSPEGIVAKLKAVEKKAAADAAKAEWIDGCQKDKQHEPRPNLANAMIALRVDPRFTNLLAYDQMERRSMLVQPPAASIDEADPFLPRAVSDIDVTRIQEQLQLSGLERIGRDIVHQAVEKRADERAYHPVIAYLQGLHWDGKSRLATWLSTYCGAEQSAYTAGVGSMFLRSMIARVHEPGCKADYMPILEGLQGIQKSTVCSILARPWYSDSLPALGRDEVRVAQHLRGKWLIEIGEMSALSRADAEELKAFLTRPVEKYTPKYGRHDVVEPRQCVFIGTTNKTADYLRDETGNRRFWPVRCGRIDTEGLRRDRDQLFAEALQQYRDGAPWWPSPAFEAEHIAPQQDARFEADTWEDVVAAFIEPQPRVTVLQVAKDALHLDVSKIGTQEQRRITATLTHLGWSRGQRGSRGERFWYPGKS